MSDRIDSNYRKNALPVAGLDEPQPRKEVEKNSVSVSDRVSLGDQDKVGKTYGPGLKVSSGYELLRRLVVKNLEEQGVTLQISTGDSAIDLTTLTPGEAQALVAEDGYFGVDKTSDRIVDFAINAFSGDPARLQEMKDAIDKGFSDAQDALGGSLPGISQQTYNAIMEKLDAFAARFKESGQ